MDLFLSTWYLSVAPTALYIFIALSGVFKTRQTAREIGHAIRCESDLSLVKSAINLNMMTAIIMLGICAVYIVSFWLMIFRGYLNMPAYLLHQAVFVAANLGFRPYLRRCEMELKTLSVINQDFRLVTTYRRWLKQWNEPRLRLPD